MTIKRSDRATRAGFIHMTYVSRAMEWVNLKGAVKQWLNGVNMLDKIEQVEQITIGWKHLPSIYGLIYISKKVFCDFLVKELVLDAGVCGCAHKRWAPYLDIDTITHGSNNTLARVQTADLKCIQDKNLRLMMACGLNHIPLQHTNLEEVVRELLGAWELMADILNLDHVTSATGACWLEIFFWSELKHASKKNFGGHRHSSRNCLTKMAIDELKYFTEHFYCSGIDKASNNIAIICCQHIRMMALNRL